MFLIFPSISACRLACAGEASDASVVVKDICGLNGEMRSLAASVRSHVTQCYARQYSESRLMHPQMNLVILGQFGIISFHSTVRRNLEQNSFGGS